MPQVLVKCVKGFATSAGNTAVAVGVHSDQVSPSLAFTRHESIGPHRQLTP
jgi:hypothetical protein